MKLDCVLTAVNEKKYILILFQFLLKTWNKLYPNVDVKIILIAKKFPDKFIKYKDNIILFKPIKGVLTSFTSQYIRLLYPAILNYKNGILITDMDMLTMNRTYYTKNIEKYDNKKFIYYRENICSRWNQIAICYNVAIPKIWSNIFDIKSLEDIKNRIINVFKNNEIIEGHGKKGWCTDQIHLKKYIEIWNKKTKNFIRLKEEKFNRLDRSNLKLLNKDIINKIKKGYYSDYHCLRPYEKYKIINEKNL